MSSQSLSNGIYRLLRIPRRARGVEFTDILKDGRPPSVAVQPPRSSRQLSPKLPGAGRVLAAYTFSVVVLGALLVVSYGSGSDNLWPLMMVPVLTVAFYYPRYVYLLMLAGYTCVSFSVIALVSEDKIEKLAITVPFLVSVGVASEVIYRLTAWREQARAALRQSEQRFRALSASAPIGIFQTDAQGMCKYVNAHYLAVSGLTLEQSLGLGWQSIIHPEDRSAFLEQWTNTPPMNHDLLHNYRILTAEGQTRWVNVTAAPLFSPAGKFMGHVGTFEDVTDRKQAAEALQKANNELESRVEQRTVELKLAIQELEQGIAERAHAEEALRESEGRYRQMFETNRAIKLVIDPESLSIIDANKAACDFYGYSRSELRTKKTADINTMSEEEARRLMTQILTGKLTSYTITHRLRSGEARDVEVHPGPIDTRGKQLVYAIIHDITERKRAEEALRESQEYLQMVIDNAGIIMFAFDREGIITLSKGKGLDSVGLGPGEIVGQSIYDRYFDRPDVLECCHRALAGESFDSLLEAQELTFQSHYSPIRDQDGAVIGGIGVSTNITERAQAEEALRQSDARFRAAMDGSLDAFAILRSVRDETGRIVDFEYVDVNNRAVEMINKKREELIGKKMCEFYPPARTARFAFPRYVQVAESGVPVEEEFPVSIPGLNAKWLRHQIIPLADGIALTSRDISERKASEAQLQDYASSQNLLLNQLMTAQEAERRRLAMDIHDGPLQSLGVSLIALDRAIRRRERGEHELVDQELRHLRDTLVSTVEEVRAVLADLNLEILVNYGFEVALRNHIERFSDVTGLEVTLHNSLKMELPPDIELLMYRLAQESLANIRKHARARQVVMSLDIVGSDLKMRITDDGQGLDVEAAFRQSQNGDKLGQKLGLRSMRQRIQAVRGDLAITSTPGHGTTLEFSCPVPFAED